MQGGFSSRSAAMPQRMSMAADSGRWPSQSTWEGSGGSGCGGAAMAAFPGVSSGAYSGGSRLPSPAPSSNDNHHASVPERADSSNSWRSSEEINPLATSRSFQPGSSLSQVASRVDQHSKYSHALNVFGYELSLVAGGVHDWPQGRREGAGVPSREGSSGPSELSACVSRLTAGGVCGEHDGTEVLERGTIWFCCVSKWNRFV